MRPAYIILLLICILYMTPAKAENLKPTNLKSLSVTSSTVAEPVLPPLTTPAITTPVLTPLEAKDAIKPLDKISEFEDLKLFLSLNNDADIARAKKIMTLTPDKVPPLAFYYLSRALAEQGDMSSAAFYYYAGELRNEFDKARFPNYKIQSQNIDPSKTKLDDQKNLVPDAPDKIIDPRGGFNEITNALGKPVRAWIVKHPAEFRDVLARVKLWDAATAYAYRPPYDLSRAADPQTWPDLLTQTRDQFFATQNEIADQLQGAKTAPAPRPFGR